MININYEKFNNVVRLGRNDTLKVTKDKIST